MIPRLVSSGLQYRGRFAPSPTGPLHFGSLVAAMASYCDARANRGSWFVRIEDLDRPRSRPAAEAQILTTLEHYGFAWDGAVLRQSERGEIYAAALERLRGADAVYECACSRRELVATSLYRDGERIYPGTCRSGIPESHGRRSQRAWRVRVGETTIEFRDRLHGLQVQNLARDAGDFVIKRADGVYAYQLAAVVDDALQDVTHVVRGADLLRSTPRQIMLQRLLGYPALSYLHTPIAIDAAGVKLSKQTNAAPLAEDALPTLIAAWRFLRQSLREQSEVPTTVGEFWSSAITAWDPGSLPPMATLSAPGG